MKHTITIDMDNAAFGEFPNMELARILREEADKLETQGGSPGYYSKLRDYNGNVVGQSITLSA